MAPLLHDKTALITGGGSGIGRAIAYQFGAEGARVVVSDIDDAGGNQTVTTLRDRRVEAIVSLTNAGHIAQINELFELAFDDETVSWRLQDQDWTPVTTGAEGGPLRDIQEYLIERVSTRRH